MFNQLWSFADSQNDKPPPIIFKLLTACLDNSLDAFECLQFIVTVRRFKLVAERSQYGVLPDSARPVLIDIRA
jgi:hypothetical protein